MQIYPYSITAVKHEGLEFNKKILTHDVVVIDYIAGHIRAYFKDGKHAGKYFDEFDEDGQIRLGKIIIADHVASEGYFLINGNAYTLLELRENAETLLREQDAECGTKAKRMGI